MNLKKLTRNSKFACVVSVLTLATSYFGGIHPALAKPVPQASSKLNLTTKSLPSATVGVEYYAVIGITGGEPPYDCSGAGLPPNLAFHDASDTLGGKANTPGTYPVVITVRDSADPPHVVSANFKLTVVAAK